MSERGALLLVTGPAGSGKSTVAARVAQELGWQCVSEDDYWVRNGWGHGLRSSEQEQSVQAQVLDDLLPILTSGTSVVLDFILYKPPPNPLTAYQDRLRDESTAFVTVALEPSVEEILRRMQRRGRPNDLADLEGRRRSAEHEVRVLESVDPSSIIDSSDLSIDEVVGLVVERARSSA